MSVTFAPEHHDSDITGWGIQCACGATRTSVLAIQHAEVVARLTTDTPVCGDEMCGADKGAVVPFGPVEEVPYVQMSNANARYVLDALGVGYEDVACGTLPALDVLGRVLVAVAIAPVDEGVPAHETREGGVTYIEGGRRPGYLDEALDSLRDVIDWAIARDRQIGWG